MNSDRFHQCLQFVLAREGGFSDDPLDRGGATCLGITQREYDAYRSKHALMPQSVRNISSAEAETIYAESYWVPMHCDALPPPLDMVMFDSAVQHGPGRATRWLQEIVGAHIDGSFGPLTLKATQTYLADRVMGLRDKFYAEIVKNDPTQQRFAKGWSNRMAALESAAGLA